MKQPVYLVDTNTPFEISYDNSMLKATQKIITEISRNVDEQILDGYRKIAEKHGLNKVIVFDEDVVIEMMNLYREKHGREGENVQPKD